MSWISTDPPDDDAARLLASLADPRTGATDEILKIHALDPVGLRAHLALYRSAMSATAGLPLVDRELVAYVVSDLNGCVY